MALGMTRDSMVDLQNLAQANHEANQMDDGHDTVNLLMTGTSRSSSQEYEKLAKIGPSPSHSDPNPAGDPPHLEMEESLRRSDGSSSSDLSKPKSPLRADGDGDINDDAEEEKKQEPMSFASSGQYSGFANDYEDYNYDAYPHFQYHHHPQTILGGPKTRQGAGGFLCCLFPWLNLGNNPNSRIMEEDADKPAAKPQEEPKEGELAFQSAASASNTKAEKASSPGEDDDLSTVSVGSDRFGDKLSDKDRQAVLARLRLAQPDQTAPPGSPDRSASGSSDAATSPANLAKDKVQQKGLLNEIPNLHLNGSDPKSDASPGGAPKGILRRQSTCVKTTEPRTGTDGIRRRSLFPTYETTTAKKNDNHVQFAPMARVVTVKSQKDMSPEEKSSIWWQRWDYEDFRKTGRIITRAMLEGGSEIWLASNQSWQHSPGTSKQTTLKNAISLSERSAKKNGVNGSETADVVESTGDKWWHKFGHSRRGLEHIASIKEGSERQANVRHAIKAVLDEQRRQKTYMRVDPEKLRMVAIHNTAWARDLALASGSSDADAVSSNFVEERKSREFYLLKMARSNNTNCSGKHVPAFMQPAMNTTITQQLDANTNAQIMYRRKQERMQRKEKEAASAASRSGTENAAKKDKAPTPAKKSMEPIHDPNPEEAKDLAKRAAGFSHDGAEQVNMAAVLSGMGAVPKNAQAVGAH
jgi:hypothetical protein